jgi:hypothetical protein
MMSIKYRTCEARWNGKGSEVVIRLHRAIFLLTYPCPPRGCSLIRYIKERRKPSMQKQVKQDVCYVQNLAQMC